MGFAAGGLAGLVGAAAWAAIAHFANLEIGYLAWAIGALVGFAVATGAGERNPLLGVIAVAITAISICGGKAAIVEVDLQSFLAEQKTDFENNLAQLTEENQLSYLADDAVAARAEAGDPVQWPEGVDPNEAAVEADYPAAVWAEAEQRWSQMDEAARSSHRNEIEDRARQNFGRYVSDISTDARVEGFGQTFGVMDLVFFGLAVFTAWGIAGKGEGEASVEATPEA